jgi:hypothetical protein
MDVSRRQCADTLDHVSEKHIRVAVRDVIRARNCREVNADRSLPTSQITSANTSMSNRERLVIKLL